MSRETEFSVGRPYRQGTVMQSLEGTRELAMEIDMRGKAVAGRGNSKHDGPEEGACMQTSS